MDNFKFEDIKYERPDFDKISKKIDEYTERLKSAKTYEETRAVMFEEDKESQAFNSMITIAYIRHTLNTADEYYEEEVQYGYRQIPVLQGKLVEFTNEIFNSPFRKELEAEFVKPLGTHGDYLKCQIRYGSYFLLSCKSFLC